jgi:hypothetical protein
MTLRRWMIVVAVVGLAIGGAIGSIRLKRRRDDFIARAGRHSSATAKFKSWAGTTRVRSKRILAFISQNLEYHAAMAAKYEHAARYPWSFVEPDPEEPDWPPPELVPQTR